MCKYVLGLNYLIKFFLGDNLNEAAGPTILRGIIPCGSVNYIWYLCSLKVFDYRGESMGKRCGRWPIFSLQSPQHIIESPYNVTIRFISDESETYRGFKAEWSTISSESTYCTYFGLIITVCILLFLVDLCNLFM